MRERRVRRVVMMVGRGSGWRRADIEFGVWTIRGDECRGVSRNRNPQ